MLQSGRKVKTLYSNFSGRGGGLLGDQKQRLGSIKNFDEKLSSSTRIFQSQPHLPEIDQVIGGPAIAGDGEVAGLGVQREQRQVHRAAQGQRHLGIHEDEDY